MIVSTTPTLEGRRITAYHGVVTGETIIGANIFRDIFAGPGLKLAEWPEKAGTLIPPADIAIYIEAEDDRARHVRLQAHTPHGSAILQGLDTP